MTITDTAPRLITSVYAYSSRDGPRVGPRRAGRAVTPGRTWAR